MKIRIAGAQLSVTRDIPTNVASIARAIEFARNAQADLLLTPEGSLSGYTHLFDVPQVEQALERVTALAREARVGLALGTCYVEPEDEKCYNQIRFYARDGQYLGFHSKTLTCGSLEHPPQGEINHFAVRPLRTFSFDGVTIGGLICNDLWANPGCTPMPDPHLTQQLAERGAQVILHAVNGGRDGSPLSDLAWQYHDANLRMRAMAGRVWIVTVDSSFPPELRCSAPSGVGNPAGEWVCQAEPQGEQFFVHTIELSAEDQGRGA
jgi:predicted amidohydrolase